jgi:hypothetical protein
VHGKEEFDAPRASQLQMVSVPQRAWNSRGQANSVHAGAIRAADVHHLITPVTQWSEFGVPGREVGMTERQPVLAAAPNGEQNLFQRDKAHRAPECGTHRFLDSVYLFVT